MALRNPRKPGTGQIVALRKQGTFLVRLYVGRDEAGRKKYDNHKVYGTQRDAEAKLHELLAARHTGHYVRTTKDSTATYLRRWLTARQWKSNRTREDYTEVCERYLIPGIGHIPLGELQRPQIQGMLTGLEQRGIGRQRLYCYQVLRAALNQAVRAAELARSPMLGVEAPAPTIKEEEDEEGQVRALSQDEARRFLDAARGSKWYALFALALDSGMRPGEYRALRWLDVAADCRTVFVRRAIEELSQGSRVKPRLKTRLSRREIPLAEQTGEILRSHWSKQLPQSSESLVFSNEKGGVLDEANLAARHFKPVLRRAGISDEHRLYDLRHTMATLLLHAGISVVTVSRRLGHAKVSMTLDRYAGCFQEHQEIAAEKLSSLLYG